MVGHALCYVKMLHLEWLHCPLLQPWSWRRTLALSIYVTRLLWGRKETWQCYPTLSSDGGSPMAASTFSNPASRTRR